MATIAGINFGKLKVVDIRKTILKSKTVKLSYRNVLNIDTLAIHHSLTTQGDGNAFANYHVHTNGWSCMGYTFVILKDGTIQFCADLNVRTPHVGNSNNGSLGICMVGDFRYSQPTEAQYQSLYGLINVLIAYDGLPKVKSAANVWGHQEYPTYGWKQCPALDMDSLRGNIAAGERRIISNNYNNDSKRKIILPSGSVPRKTIQEPVKVVPQPKQEQVKRSVLREGFRGTDVKEMQSKLVALGYDTNGVDSIFGPGTEKAVRAFQKDYRLVVDGIAGAATLGALQNELKYSGLLKEGSKGEAVKIVQRAVGAAVDGIFGPKTTAAVKQYQRDKKLSVDGVVGPKTWEAIV